MISNLIYISYTLIQIQIIIITFFLQSSWHYWLFSLFDKLFSISIYHPFISFIFEKIYILINKIKDEKWQKGLSFYWALFLLTIYLFFDRWFLKKIHLHFMSQFLYETRIFNFSIIFRILFNVSQKVYSISKTKRSLILTQ